MRTRGALLGSALPPVRRFGPLAKSAAAGLCSWESPRARSSSYYFLPSSSSSISSSWSPASPSVFPPLAPAAAAAPAPAHRRRLLSSSAWLSSRCSSSFVPSSNSLQPFSSTSAPAGGRSLSLEASKRSGTEEEEKETGSEEDGIRVNKCFREIASRRQSEKFISEGRVRVNGRVATQGERVHRGDSVTLDGKLVDWEHLNFHEGGHEKKFVYIKYWKPRGIVCTTDTRVRNNIVDAVGHSKRIFPVGRLDKETTGLVILTSDGRLPNKILKSRERKKKTYMVVANRKISEHHVEKLREGVLITTLAQRDRKVKPLTAYTLPAEVEQLKDNCIRISITEGRNRQIRKMMEALGYEVIELHRTGVMGIGLDGLSEGKWIPLTAEEMAYVEDAFD
mmetsp:Transcript_6043/g.14597  ORF Transcript_6043/g.14597 Transcript_6043/m.14597 type:complete len:393 (-) Transcript_6043:421-1599(-)